MMISIVGVWYALCFIIIRKVLKRDFNIEFKKINKIEKKINEFIENVLRYVWIICLFVLSILSFGAAYEFKGNILRRIIFIIVGCIFVLPVWYFYKDKKEAKLNKNKVKKTSKETSFNINHIIYIIGIAAILFGLLFLMVYYENIENKVKRTSNCNKYNFCRL